MANKSRSLKKVILTKEQKRERNRERRARGKELSVLFIYGVDKNPTQNPAWNSGWEKSEYWRGKCKKDI